jgi:hypothetical protein
MTQIVTVSLDPILVAYADDLAARETVELRKVDPKDWRKRSEIVNRALATLRYVRHDHAQPLNALRLTAEALKVGAMTRAEAGAAIEKIVCEMDRVRLELGAAAMRATGCDVAAPASTLSVRNVARRT